MGIPTAGVAASAFGLLVLAGFVQGASAFGLGIVAMALLPLVVPPKTAAVSVVFCSLIVTSWMWWRLRGSEVWGIAAPVLAGSTLVGLPIGTLLLKCVPAGPMRLAIGCMVVVAAVLVAVISRGEAEGDEMRCPGFPLAFLVGILSGVLNGFISMGGPPLVVLLALKRVPKREVAATLQAVFTVNAVVRVPMLLAAGELDVYRLVLGLVLGAGALVGCFFGTAVFEMVGARTVRRFAIVLLLVAGARQVVAGLPGRWEKAPGAGATGQAPAP
jgi:uncharacterized membrane protein YfcA